MCEIEALRGTLSVCRSNDDPAPSSPTNLSRRPDSNVHNTLLYFQTPMESSLVLENLLDPE